MKYMPYEPTPDQYKWLHALYSGMVTLWKYREDEELRTDMHKKFSDYATTLDNLGVPWHIQNMVAAAGEKKENWDRYNRAVLNEVFGKCFVGAN